MSLAAKGLMVALLAVAAADATTVGASPPKVYVGLFRDDAVAVIDSATQRVVRTVAVPKGPHGLVVTPDGRKVYVSSDGASTVSVIDTATDQVVTSIDVGPNPHGLAMAPGGSRVLVSSWGAGQAMFIDTTTDRVVSRVPVAQAHNGTLSADGRTAWVASQQQGATALVQIDVPGALETARVPLDWTPRALDLSPDGRRLYFTVAGQAAVLVLDTATRQIVGQIAVGASPHQAPLTADGRWALVPSQGPGELGMIDTTTGAVVSTVRVGKTPHWVAVGSNGALAYVTNEASNDVSVVDLGSRRVIATVPVGNAPRKVAVQPGPIPLPAAATLAEVAVRVDDYSFTPPVLHGRAGQPLRLRIRNAASTLHNLSVPSVGLDRDLLPQADAEVQLTIPAAGPVAFFCKFHEALGQRGQLVVDHGS
jgi:YVTN family beta-propeller protein